MGKTYAMLGEGHRRAERGANVVVGFAEAHGARRPPRCSTAWKSSPGRLEYRGGAFEEMDLDAVLTRRPEIALVDELAHTNVPGSRNEKRSQDIEELLDAGINVISAVNIGTWNRSTTWSKRSRARSSGKPCRTRSSARPIRSRWST